MPIEYIGGRAYEVPAQTPTQSSNTPTSKQPGYFEENARFNDYSDIDDAAERYEKSLGKRPRTGPVPDGRLPYRSEIPHIEDEGARWPDKLRKDIPVQENAAIRSNQEKWKQWAGGPVKQQNKISKNAYTNLPVTADWAEPHEQTQMGRQVNREFARTQNLNTRRLPSGVIVPSDSTYFKGGINRFAGPIGKLPLVGALPMPTTMQGAMQDEQAGMDWRQRMLNFLSRSAGVDPNYNPEGI
jgi:hypothetical protein